jgi:tetratricopeptide (TPR) repeat protein
MWWAPAGADYFPLKETVQWFEWHLWGDRPFGYHVVSLGLHLVSAFLCWRLLSKLGTPFAWSAALVFLVHPVAVESVAWIAELKNTLSLPLLLLSALAFVTFAERAELEPPQPRLGWYGASLLLFLASALAKSSVVMFPTVLLLYGWYRHRRIVARDLVLTSPFFLVSAGIGAATVWFQEHRAIAGVVAETPSLAARLADAGHAILFYFGKAIFPVGISPVYPALREGPVSCGSFVPWFLLALAVGLLVWRRATWGRAGLLALGWFVLHLVPILGLVRMSFARIAPVSDHFAYVSLLGLIGGLAALAGLVAERLRRISRPLALAGGGVLALLVGALLLESRELATHYQSDRAFWSFASERNPTAWAPRNNLGLMLLEEGHPAEAAAQFEAVLRSGVRQAEVYNNLGDAEVRLGHYPAAIGAFQTALSLQPGYPVAEGNLGNVYAQTGQFPQAEEHLRRSLELKPDNPDLHTHLGLVYGLTGHPDLAVAQYREAMRENPLLAEPHYRLASLLANAGRLPEALAEYDAAIRLNPNYAEAYAEKGLALVLSHRASEAMAPLALAVRLRPESVEAEEYLGFALNSLGRSAEAVAAYQAAVRLGGKGSELYYNLGTALRASGQPEAARAAFRMAEQLSGP